MSSSIPRAKTLKWASSGTECVCGFLARLANRVPRQGPAQDSHSGVGTSAADDLTLNRYKRFARRMQLEGRQLGMDADDGRQCRGPGTTEVDLG